MDAMFFRGTVRCIRGFLVLDPKRAHEDMNRRPYAESFARRMAKMATKPSLDVQVCDHCNLRCAGCLHFAPLAGERFLDLDAYVRDLAQLAAIEGIGGYFGSIVLMGGEPLLHPRVVEVVRTTRKLLPGEHIGLCTNGLLLKRMGADFWDALAECDIDLALSPYPIRIDYGALIEYARERGVRARATGDITGTGENKDVFMHLALNPDGTCNPAASFTSCPFGGHHMQLARGALWPCQVAAHHGDFAQRFGFDMHDAPDDSLPLAAIESADDVETFRRRAHPMCRFCDNGALTVAQWKPSKLEAGEWLA